MSKLHKLKTWPEYFQEVVKGRKTFEIRKNDREFAVGDVLQLQEYDPVNERYTGIEATAEVTYMTDFAQQNGYVVMAIRFLNLVIVKESVVE